MIPPHEPMGPGLRPPCWCAPPIGFVRDDEDGQVYIIIDHTWTLPWYVAHAIEGQPPA